MMEHMDLTKRHQATQHIMRLFEYGHLPANLQGPAHACADLAWMMVEKMPDGTELTVGLRKLVEAKEAFVRHAELEMPDGME